MSENVKVAYWYSDKTAGNNVQEYRGVGRVQIMSGALVIHDESDAPRLIIAPGDWHDVVLEDEES